MNLPARALAPLLAVTLISACGAAPAPASATTSAAPAAGTATAVPTTAAPTVAAASPSPSPAPAYAGVGAAVAKIAETTYAAKTTPVHVSFLGDQAALPAGTYVETLSLVTLQPGGRTISHKHGGLETVIVIEGSVLVDMGAAGKVTLKTGEKATVPAETPLQARNAGTTVARFLAFFMTPQGKPFQTNLNAVP